jgi:hypothetical protein
LSPFSLYNTTVLSPFLRFSPLLLYCVLSEVVLKEVSAPFKAVRRVEVVVVVGGFSEHKQRRLLCGGSGEDLEQHLESGILD